MYSRNSSNGFLGHIIPGRTNSILGGTSNAVSATTWPSSKLPGHASLDAMPRNQILADLPNDDRMRLFQSMEMVRLSRHEDLHDVEHGDCFIYFPQSVVISQLSMLNDGSTAEVALVGNEGVIGLSFIFNTHIPERRACVALAGNALRMRAKDFKREFECGGALQHSLLEYMGNYVEQISQRSVCNSQHSIEKRFACWLLMMHDRASNDVLPLTQEQIAYRIGTRRSSITLAAMALQEQQIISYFRGQIHILDRRRLELTACECYETLSQTSNKSTMVSH